MAYRVTRLSDNLVFDTGCLPSAFVHASEWRGTSAEAAAVCGVWVTGRYTGNVIQKIVDGPRMFLGAIDSTTAFIIEELS